MKFLTSLSFVLVAMVTVDITTGQIYDEWIKTQNAIGGPIQFNCSEYCGGGCHPRSPLPEEYSVVRSWMGPAPDLYVWNVTSADNISQAECPSCQILDDGWTFRINSFDPNYHVGIYHCMLYNETMNSYFLVKWGVNMKGPYFEDLLDKYEMNIIYGVSAFGSFLFIAFAIILTYKFRWVPDETEDKNNIPTYGSTIKAYGMEPAYNGTVEGKVNPVFEVESPPQYNGVKAHVEVHSSDDGARPGTSSSSSSSEGGSLRRREPEDETTRF